VLNGITFHALIEGEDHLFPALTQGRHHGVSRLVLPKGCLDLSVVPRSEGKWFAGVVWTGQDEIALHLGIRLAVDVGVNAFTLVPGACYNGNEGLPVKDIPTLSTGRMEIPWSEAAAPVALHADGQGNGVALTGAPLCQQGWCGCIVDRRQSALWHVAPVLANRRYRHARWDEQPRPPARLNNGETLGTWFQVDRFPAQGAADLLSRLFDKHRAVAGQLCEAHPKVELETAARLVGDWMLQNHAVNLGGSPCLLNAFESASSLRPGDPGFPLDWHQITGWCGGPMTACGLLALGGEHAKFAVANLDFLAVEAPGRHGLARPVFDGKKWHDHLGGVPGGCSIRMPADYCLWMLRAAASEALAGRMRPAWKAAARRGLEAMCQLWEKHGEFGYAWDWSKPEPVLVQGGGCTGAFALLALSEGLRAWPGDPLFIRTARAAAAQLAPQAYAGRCQGGPLDILLADDSESVAALTEALLRLSQLLEDPGLLKAAEAAGRLFASWVLGWAPPFPPGSALEGINVCGGVLANVQNRHVGPGICTSSARFLHDLAQVTGDLRWEQLYRDVLSAAVNCLPVTEGEMLGLTGTMSHGAGSDAAVMGWTPVAPGMLTEQINVADCLGKPGEFWPVSASWGMTSILLAWAERPKQDLCPERAKYRKVVDT